MSIRATTPARSGWSEYVSLDSAENQVVTCEALTSAQDRKADPFYSTCEYAVGVVTRVGSGPFARTNMVRLTFFLFFNYFYRFCAQEQGVKIDPIPHIIPDHFPYPRSLYAPGTSW